MENIERKTIAGCDIKNKTIDIYNLKVRDNWNKKEGYFKVKIKFNNDDFFSGDWKVISCEAKAVDWKETEKPINELIDKAVDDWCNIHILKDKPLIELKNDTFLIKNCVAKVTNATVFSFGCSEIVCYDMSIVIGYDNSITTGFDRSIIYTEGENAKGYSHDCTLLFAEKDLKNKILK